MKVVAITELATHLNLDANTLREGSIIPPRRLYVYGLINIILAITGNSGAYRRTR
jgi:hypothetical protein